MKNKRMSIKAMIITDTIVTLLAIGIFMLFQVVIPKIFEKNYKNPLRVDNLEENNVMSNYLLPEGINEKQSIVSENGNDVNVNTYTSLIGGNAITRTVLSTGNYNTRLIESNKLEASDLNDKEVKSTILENYKNNNIKLTITKNEVGKDSDKITYYVGDIYVTSLKYLKTAFAEGSYGKNLKEMVNDISNDNNALLAISGDSYGNCEKSVVIRNGKLYRCSVTDTDICVLFKDGSMKTYSPKNFNKKEVIKKGAWQAWTFGPNLLSSDGKIADTFNTTTYINSKNPRCSIGYVEPGHYVFTVVDGHDTGYSRGCTLSELAQIMINNGCSLAYNLDGGGAAAMVYKGKYINKPSDDRTISDIIYIK